MVFGHNPFVWTPVQVIKNAETASGTMVFNGMFDWIPGVGDDDEEDENGGTGIDFIDDIVDTITEWTSKITETFNVGLDFITVKDKKIDVKTITKCCNGVPRKFIYGIYEVNSEVSAQGGPRTVGNQVWSAGDRYATFREYQWTPANYQNGNDNGRWNNYQEGALGRLRATSLSDEYQVLADDSSQSIKDFYDEIITQRIGEACEDGPFGCMNPTASNYNSNAVCPDGSCECGNDDEAGNEMKMDSSGNCYVEQCTGSDTLHRTINNDGSCGPCDDGYYRGSGTGCIEKTTQCQLDTDWSGWSDCENGTQSRTKQKGTPPAGWTFTANSCLPIAFGALGTLTETETEVIDTRTCTITGGGTGGRSGNGDEPPEVEACDDENRETKDDGSCDADCKDGYEFDDDDICVEIPDEEKGLPVGLILGGVAVALGAFVMMQKK